VVLVRGSAQRPGPCKAADELAAGEMGHPGAEDVIREISTLSTRCSSRAPEEHERRRLSLPRTRISFVAGVGSISIGYYL
jgi:hypothetical protein